MGTHPFSPARAKAAVRLAAFLLLLGAAAPAAAQQPRDTSRVVPADTTPAAATTPLAGPRREVTWQPYRPQLLPRSEARGSAAGDSMQTIRISTVALVLIGVIVHLLLVR